MNVLLINNYSISKSKQKIKFMFIIFEKIDINYIYNYMYNLIFIHKINILLYIII